MNESQTFVTVNNFNKYNPRHDRKSHSWFRLEHDLFTNSELFSLNNNEKMVWIYLLCLASKSSGDKIIINWDHVDRIGGFQRKQFEVALEKLQQIKLITCAGNQVVTSRLPGSGITSHAGSPTNVRTYERTNDIAQTSSSEFDLVYEKYPRKEGKQKGIEVMKREVKNGSSLKEIESAIERYSRHCKSERTEPKFIKHFSSFMSTWRDWLDPKAGKVEFPKTKNVHPPVVSFDKEPEPEPFTPEQIEANKKRIQDLMQKNGMRPI